MGSCKKKKQGVAREEKPEKGWRRLEKLTWGDRLKEMAVE